MAPTKSVVPVDPRYWSLTEPWSMEAAKAVVASCSAPPNTAVLNESRRAADGLKLLSSASRP